MKWVRRIFFLIIGLPVLVVLGLVALGQRPNAGRSVERIAIARPPAQVFLHLVDEARLQRWTRLAEVRKLTEGPFRPGSRLRVVSEARGQRTVMNVDVTAVDPDRRLTTMLRTAPGSAVGVSQLAEYRLEEKKGDTRLTVTLDCRYDGVILGLLEPLITRGMQRQLENSLDRLRAQVEAEPIPSDPAP
jgi:uncharacterized protein YndB with AHSA1/START domain